ncbi:MAG: hypothetical protein DSY60_06080 [Persephonella sp.]|nr:MAG: hypothetical protein DSY60_06080 [Persephonella sp.]
MEFLGELHPPIVHFAIALVIVSVIFDFFGLILKKDSLKNAGFWTLVVGAIAVIGAFITGHQAEELVEKAIEGTETYKRLEIHETVGNFVLGAVLLLTAFRVFVNKKSDIRLMGIYLLLGFLVISVVGLQGRIGGKLVYEFGVGVKPVMTEELNKSNNNGDVGKENYKYKEEEKEED